NTIDLSEKRTSMMSTRILPEMFVISSILIHQSIDVFRLAISVESGGFHRPWIDNRHIFSRCSRCSSGFSSERTTNSKKSVISCDAVSFWKTLIVNSLPIESSSMFSTNGSNVHSNFFRSKPTPPNLFFSVIRRVVVKYSPIWKIHCLASILLSDWLTMHGLASTIRTSRAHLIRYLDFVKS
ncbi:hypothetical protein PMAYCL1PPCAC_28696, partial [Pristionchus mayeri]